MRAFFFVCTAILAAGCSHPLEIVGEGDILSASGDRDCLLEQFLDGNEACSKNTVSGAYNETYYAQPRAGWQFDHWANYCSDAPDNACSFDIDASIVRQFWGEAASPLQAIFRPQPCASPEMPSAIFVLDNTASWSRQAQAWPGGLVQGQSEVRAIQAALAGLTNQFKVGVIEFTTEGSSGINGGYVRFDLQELTNESQLILHTRLDEIFNNINSTTERRSAGTEYGNLIYDVYNYLSGSAQSFGGSGTPATLADYHAYVSLFNQFRSPLSPSDQCSSTHLIFIGNPSSSGPTGDDAPNSRALSSLYDAAEAVTPDELAAGVGGNAPLPLPEFVVTRDTVPGQTLGLSTSCWKVSEANACMVEENAPGGLCGGLEDCGCVEISSNTTGCVTSGPRVDRNFRWRVGTADEVTTQYPLTGGADLIAGADYNLDDWAKFLHNYGVPVSSVHDGQTVTGRVGVTTHTIDVFNAQQNFLQSSLLFSAARSGGGSYSLARSEDEIRESIEDVLRATVFPAEQATSQ